MYKFNKKCTKILKSDHTYGNIESLNRGDRYVLFRN